MVSRTPDLASEYDHYSSAAQIVRTRLPAVPACSRLAATGGDADGQHAFYTRDLPALFEQLIVQLQDFPATPTLYRPQREEPSFRTRPGSESTRAISGCCPHRATERFLLVLPLTLLKQIVVRGGSIWPAKAGLGRKYMSMLTNFCEYHSDIESKPSSSRFPWILILANKASILAKSSALKSRSIAFRLSSM